MRDPYHRRRRSGDDAGAPRLHEARLRASTLPRARDGNDLGRRSGAHLSADGQEIFLRRAVQPARRPRRSEWRNQCLREGRAQYGRRGLSLHARHRADAAHRWIMGRHHRQGLDQRAARGQCGRVVGTRSRTDGRPGIADPRDGTSISGHRRDSGSRRIGKGSTALHRLRRRNLHAPGGQGDADRHL